MPIRGQGSMYRMGSRAAKSENDLCRIHVLLGYNAWNWLHLSFDGSARRNRVEGSTGENFS